MSVYNMNREKIIATLDNAYKNTLALDFKGYDLDKFKNVMEELRRVSYKHSSAYYPSNSWIIEAYRSVSRGGYVLIMGKSGYDRIRYFHFSHSLMPDCSVGERYKIIPIRNLWGPLHVISHPSNGFYIGDKKI